MFAVFVFVCIHADVSESSAPPVQISQPTSEYRHDVDPADDRSIHTIMTDALRREQEEAEAERRRTTPRALVQPGPATHEPPFRPGPEGAAAGL